MSDEKEFECNFCNKKFVNKSNLTLHQKTAKFCIELRNKSNESIQIKTYNCEFCNKIFTVKSNLNVHLETCKTKKEEEYKKFEELKIETIKLKEEIKALNKIIEEQNKTIENLTKKTNNTTIYQNTNYNVQFNQFFKDLREFTDNNVLSYVNNITRDKIIRYGYTVNDSFSSCFASQMKAFAVCVDVSRKKLLIKNEDGFPSNIPAEKFIYDCIKKGKNPILNLLSTANRYVRDDENLSEENRQQRIIEITLLYQDINKKELNQTTQNISNQLLKVCDQLSSKDYKVMLTQLEN